jgi:hypothetical protein
MIQISSSISSLSFQTNINQSDFVSLPEITSVIHPQQNNFITMNHADMNSQGINRVSVYIYYNLNFIFFIKIIESYCKCSRC